MSYSIQSLSLCFCLSVSLSLFISPFMFMSLTGSLSHSFCLSVSMSLSVCLDISFCLFCLYPCLLLPRLLSLFQHNHPPTPSQPPTHTLPTTYPHTRAHCIFTNTQTLIMHLKKEEKSCSPPPSSNTIRGKRSLRPTRYQR